MSGSTLTGGLPPSAFLYQREENRYVCQEGKVLHPQGRCKVRPGLLYYRYEAKAEDCQTCSRKPECCPDNEKRGRSVARPEESPVESAFRLTLPSQEPPAPNRHRGKGAEFCHA